MNIRIDKAVSVFRNKFSLNDKIALDKKFVPVLMYHSISDRAENRRNSYYWINTKTEIFENQIAYLHNSGYEAVDLSSAFDQLYKG